ncbi:MAG: peptidase M20 [Bellilinea sp.]|nr:MAG: peptidase M20 [Bellilinea sp.]
MIPLPADLLDYIVEQTARIQQIPAPTFQEVSRAVYLRDEMLRIGLDEVFMDEQKNVFARWKGGNAPPLILSAHLDSVHPADLPLPLEVTTGRITGPGAADNALGLAALLTIGKCLVQHGQRFEGDVWLVADVGEEGLGNLAGMRAVVERFGEEVQGYVVLEGLGLGQVCHRGLGVARYRITAQCQGGHAWVNQGEPSAIHELAAVIHQMAEIILPQKPRSSLNVGIVRGGTSINTIAASAFCEVDLRSEDQNGLNRLIQRVKRIVSGRERKGIHFEMELIGLRPAGSIRPSHPLVKLALECLAELQVPAVLEIGSTDANIPLSRGIPAVCLGLTRGGAPHTVNEYLEIPPIHAGLQQILMIIERLWQKNGIGRG